MNKVKSPGEKNVAELEKYAEKNNQRYPEEKER